MYFCAPQAELISLYLETELGTEWTHADRGLLHVVRGVTADEEAVPADDRVQSERRALNASGSISTAAKWQSRDCCRVTHPEEVGDGPRVQAGLLVDGGEQGRLGVGLRVDGGRQVELQAYNPATASKTAALRGVPSRRRDAPFAIWFSSSKVDRTTLVVLQAGVTVKPYLGRRYFASMLPRM